VTVTDLCRLVFMAVTPLAWRVTDRATVRTTEIPYSRGDKESNEHHPLSSNNHLLRVIWRPHSASPSWLWAIPKIILPSPPKTTPRPPTAYPSPSLPNLTAPPFNPLADSPPLPMNPPLFLPSPSSVALTGLPYQHAHPRLDQPVNSIIGPISIPPCQNTLAAKT
jgi:hypothetical protein